MRKPFVFAFAFLFLSALLSAQPVQAKHAQVELLSSQADAVPGSELLVGVHFVLEKGWHIYWVNPGDSGQPPSFQWQLPPGFTAGAIEWPRPERMQSSAQVADYGYHDEVLLMVPVKAAQFININGRPLLEFSVDAKWLICREVCLPDHAHLRGEWALGTGQKVSPQTAALFANAQRLLPKPMPQGWKLAVTSEQDAFVLSLASKGSPKRPPGQPQFFPLEPAQVENALPQKVQTIPDGFSITIKKSDLLIKPIKTLRGVLVFPDGQAYQVEAPVIPGKGIK
jgi:DsbC/DsbD-like thiol-disulfide interchange protein